MNNENNEFMLWVGIMAIIAVFIFFMPDIERLIFGRPKKMNIKTEEVNTNNQNNKQAQNSKQNKNTNNVAKESTYECTMVKNESFYNQNENIKYIFDSKGNTLSYNGNIEINVNSVDSYNQMKTTYQGLSNIFNGLGEDFKKYYEMSADYNDTSKTIKLTSKLTDYDKAMTYINNYNNSHQDSTISINVYSSYKSAEINMKSDGYTCKLS